MASKTDNRSLGDKVRLRSAICAGLEEPLRVLDLFSGEGWIWKKMREKFEVRSYTPVDVRPRQPGTIRMEVTGRTVRVFDPARFNVIDIDAYGDPWEIWASVAERLRGRTAIFITNGIIARGGGSLSNFLKSRVGMPVAWIPPVNDKLVRHCGRRYLVSSLSAFEVERALYIEHQAGGGFDSSHHAAVDYYGLLVRPRSHPQD